MEALRQIRDLFPDGIGHLLTEGGAVHPDHLLTEDDRAANAESDEHVAGWKAAGHRIDLGHAANEPTAKSVEEDGKFNDELNKLPTAEEFENYAAELMDAADADEAVSEYPAAMDALSAVGETLKAIEESDAPDHPERPDPEDYRLDPSDLDDEFDEPGERRDHLRSLREEHESNADDFEADAETYRDDAAKESTRFREEQGEYLQAVGDAVDAALALASKEWGADRERARRLQGEAVRLGERVKAILKTLSPRT